MTSPSRALVERLAGHPGVGQSSRTARLTVSFRLAHSIANHDGTWTLLLTRDGRELGDGDMGDEAVEVYWSRTAEAFRCCEWSSLDAANWLEGTQAGQDAAFAAQRSAP